MEKTILVRGMHCKSCVMLVTDALDEIGASKIRIDLDEKKQLAKVMCEFEGEKKYLAEAIKKEGYKVEQ